MIIIKGTRTDLALELRKEHFKEIPKGIEENEYVKNGITVTKTTVISDEASEKLGKEKGIYTTISFGDTGFDDKSISEISDIALSEFEGFSKSDSGAVLIIGLGNPALTSDSIGPLTTEKIIVTRHLKELTPQIYKSYNLGDVACISPDVLGNTGIETFETVKAITDTIKPDTIILIDSLAAMDINRLCKNLQISNTGISPGSGVGNHRKELSKKSLGVPVFSIGVPTVITIPDGDGGSLIVTPKDIDIKVRRCSDIISGFLNRMLHKKLSPNDFSVFLNA